MNLHRLTLEQQTLTVTYLYAIWEGHQIIVLVQEGLCSSTPNKLAGRAPLIYTLITTQHAIRINHQTQ